MRDFAQDLRVGLRALAQRPGFAAIIVVALGLGVGVNTVVFSAVNTLVLRRLPAVQPERLVTVESGLGGDVTQGGNPLSYPHYLRLREQREIFDDALAVHFDG